MNTKAFKQAARRIAIETAIIIASVFVAVTLESEWQERQRQADARAALGQLLAELRQDRAELEGVLAEQNDLDAVYRRTIAWLGEPEILPVGDFGKAIETLAYSNRTMFPRRAAWTTMVASGELTLLENPDLVTRLGNLYENLNARLLANGLAYDDQLFTEMRERVPAIWDINERRLLTGDNREIAEFRGRLRILHHTWNQWYIEFLSATYLPQLDSVISVV